MRGDDECGARRTLGWLGGGVVTLGSLATVSTGLRELPDVIDQWTGRLALLIAFLSLAIAALGVVWGVTADHARWQGALRRAWRRESDSKQVEPVAETAARIVRQPEPSEKLVGAARSQVSQLYRGTDIRISAFMIVLSVIVMLASLTTLAVLAERTPAAAPAAASENQYDGPPLPVKVTFLKYPPGIASSPDGCTPATIDYALMVGGTRGKPVLRFVNRGGPVPTSPLVQVPQRSGDCKEHSWEWTAGETGVVFVEDAS